MKDELILRKINDYAEITIDRPSFMNALNIEIVVRLNRLIDEVEEDKKIKCLIITGEGEKAFIAGADIQQLETMQPKDAITLIEIGYKVFNRIENLSIPVIASINGYCLGGGLELAMCCDIRISSDNAKFALPEIKLGVIPGWGGTIRLPRLIGEGRAKEMIYTGRMINSDEALNYGLITSKYENVKALREATNELAKELSSKPVITMGLDKSLINNGIGKNASETSNRDALGLAYVFTTEDTKEGISAFVEKRTPQFKGL